MDDNRFQIRLQKRFLQILHALSVEQCFYHARVEHLPRCNRRYKVEAAFVER